MATPRTTILLIGATGYIGGSVLTHLLAHSNAKSLDITALIRSEEKAKKLEQFGVKAVIGSYGEVDKLESLAEQSQVVFSCADADNLAAIDAILRGLKRRHASAGIPPILIHTSGTGTLAELANGMYATETIYSDLNVEQIKAIPPAALHRNVDLAVVKADEEGYARTYIVLPSTVYGVADNALVKAGVANSLSQQIPDIIRASIGRGQGGMVGEGKAIWPNVHIDDVAELYVTVFNAALNNSEGTGHGWGGFYFGENGEHTWYDISKAVSVAMVELDIGGTDEPTTFTKEELIKFWHDELVGNYSGSTARCRADRGRAIGWKPRYTTADMIASIKPEVELLWKKAEQEGGVKLRVPEVVAAMRAQNAD
ncbi:NAD(P)-binding protein [Wolfiporia cocos MD-104 SS10]|uniref:NAD(P)-binding protein n=1 Tax=Wolfiporia cocos (strain MD-104) TaxID=742152 RepID=A0A2H3IWS8_WOLCO|nr:NAD(P)-binding protein [Wolfiporia cocos MD-104 SS10]